MNVSDLSIKQQAVSVVGVKAVSFGGTIYAMGGYTGTAVGTMSQLTVPSDICSLIDVDSVCDDTSGCSLCVLTIPETGKNKTLCYSSDRQRPAGYVWSSVQLAVFVVYLWKQLFHKERITNACTLLHLKGRMDRDIFFPLGKMIGIVQLQTSFIMSL